MKKNVLFVQPERCYRKFVGDTNTLKPGDIVPATVQDYDFLNQILHCTVGNTTAYIRNENISYPAQSEKTYRYLIGKQIIAELVEIYPNGSLELNRKKIIKSTFNYLSNSIGTIVKATVESFASYGTFVDIGNGITSLLLLKDSSICRYSKPYFYFNKGDKISLKITGFDPISNHFFVSRKEAYALDYPKVHSVVTVKCCQTLNTSSAGVFVEYNPRTTGIMDIPKDLYFAENTEVFCFIKKITSKGFKANFLSFV